MLNTVHFDPWQRSLFVPPVSSANAKEKGPLLAGNRSWPLNREPLPLISLNCVGFNSRSYNAEIAHLQSALDDGYTDNNFSGYIKPVPHFKAIIGRLFPKIILTFTSEHFFLYPCSFAKKRCNTLQGFGAFFFQSCDHCSFLLFSRLFFSRSFLTFMVTRD